MSSEYSPSGSRRSSNRSGGRRPGRSTRSPRTSTHEAPVQKEASFLEKVIGFFTGKKSEPERPVREERERRPRSSEPRSSESRGSESRGSESRSSDRAQRERSGRGDRPIGMRSPEVVEVTSPRLYVGNLSFDASESDLFELFNGVGTVQNVEVVVNRHTMRSKGFAFVQMQSLDEAKRAVSELHDKDFMGRKLVVSGAKALEERRSERSQESASEAPAESVAAAE
jgi:RNA recognition motif-containing protein